MPKSRSYKPYCHAYNAQAFLSAGTVDDSSNVIPGVLIISAGAFRGHHAVKEDNGKLRNYNPENPAHQGKPMYQIVGDAKMLDQVVESGNKRPSVKAKMNHSSDVATHFGFYSNFRREGDNVRADLTLFDDLQAAKVVRNIAKHTPTEYGNSIEYNYEYELDATGKIALARCKNLSSVDIVDDPAATKSLLEEIETEDPQPPQDMPLSDEDLQKIGGLIQSGNAALKSEITTEVSTKIAAIETKVDGAVAKLGTSSASATASTEDIEKAALTALHKAMPQANIEKLNALATQEPLKQEQTFDDVVKAKLSTVPTLNKAQAIRICATEHADLYNKHRAMVG
jgi:hypothetical protein